MKNATTKQQAVNEAILNNDAINDSLDFFNMVQLLDGDIEAITALFSGDIDSASIEFIN